MTALARLAVRQSHKMVELRLGPQEDCALLGEIFLGERPFLAGAGGYAGLDIVLHR